MRPVFGTFICFAVQVNAQDLENEQAFSISSQPLCSSLTRFAEQSCSAEQYEDGIKTEFFGGRLRATLVYYDLTKTNVATPHPNSALAVQGFSVFGAIRSRVSELDITGETLPGWNMIATYSNIDARIVDSGSGDATFNTHQAAGTRFWNVPQNIDSRFIAMAQFLTTNNGLGYALAVINILSLAPH